MAQCAGEWADCHGSELVTAIGLVELTMLRRAPPALAWGQKPPMAGSKTSTAVNEVSDNFVAGRIAKYMYMNGVN